jgi:hypothetical protein
MKLKLVSIVSVAAAACMSQAGGAERGSALAIPVPKQGLPRPYSSVTFSPASDEQAQYAQYLQQTALFPDQATCDRALTKLYRKVGPAESIKRTWVTKPFLAWGGTSGSKHANVGPVSSLYSIIEAHVSFVTREGVEQRQTFSCAVNYAGISDRNVWRKGHVVYIGSSAEGHNKYQTGPANRLTIGPPGEPDDWEAGFRYYSAD